MINRLSAMEYAYYLETTKGYDTESAMEMTLAEVIGGSLIAALALKIFTDVYTPMKKREIQEGAADRRAIMHDIDNEIARAKKAKDFYRLAEIRNDAEWCLSQIDKEAKYKSKQEYGIFAKAKTKRGNYVDSNYQYDYLAIKDYITDIDKFLSANGRDRIEASVK